MIPNGHREPTPWYFAGVSILVIVLALGAVALFGVIENTRLQDSAEQTIQYDVAVAGIGDDIRVAVLDLRHHHRNIVFSGPTDAVIAEFDGTYAELLAQIDRLEQVGVTDLDVPQPDEMRSLAATYNDAFRPTIVLFTSDPIAFNTASEVGLARLDELEGMADQINSAGERLAANSLAQVEKAANRERMILIALLSGVALVGIALSVSTGRVLHRLQTARQTEQSARAELAETLKMKSDFIADASHELRTPLTLIQGNAELGLAAERDQDRVQALTEIQTESVRMGRLVNDLLFLARSDAGSPTLEREYMPVQWLLDRLTTPAEAIARHYGVSLQADLRGHGHLEVDPDRIEQAVLIVVENAAKFSPEDESVVMKSLTDSDSLTVEISDHGPGISAEEQLRVFERFYQVLDPVPRSHRGAGLGLAIAKSIVNGHGGEISVDSEHGKGTSIRITIPLSRA